MQLRPLLAHPTPPTNPTSLSLTPSAAVPAPAPALTACLVPRRLPRRHGALLLLLLLLVLAARPLGHCCAAPPRLLLRPVAGRGGAGGPAPGGRGEPCGGGQGRLWRGHRSGARAGPGAGGG
jgi:hypothetical protein